MSSLKKLLSLFCLSLVTILLLTSNKAQNDFGANLNAYEVSALIENPRVLNSSSGFYIKGLVSKGLNIPFIVKGFMLLDSNLDGNRLILIPKSDMLPRPSTEEVTYRVKFHNQILVGDKEVLILKEY